MRIFGAFVHHCIAHPLLFWTRGCPLALRLHDWTAKIAWGAEGRS